MERVLKEIGFKILSALLSTGIGLTFNYFTSNAPAGMTLVVGMLSFLIVTVLELLFRTQTKLTDLASSVSQQKTLTDLASSVSQQKTLTDLASSLEYDGMSRMAFLKALSLSGRDLSQSETNAAWCDLSWLAQKDYVATNYSDPRIFYNSGHAKDVLQLQQAKLAVNSEFRVRKVLIWKDTAERESETAKKILQLHRGAHKDRMEVSQILRDDISKSPALKNDLKEQLNDRLDFAIFDSLAVLAWRVNSERQPEKGEVIVSKTEVEKFQNFFVHLAKESDQCRFGVGQSPVDETPHN